MEEQQTGMTTPTSEPSTEGPSITVGPKPPQKLNRKQRRSMRAITAKFQRKEAAEKGKRLNCYHELADWKTLEEEMSQMSKEQIDSVFRVGLSRLFRKNFDKRSSFSSQLKAIVKNVKAGFKYKHDVAPVAPQETQSAEG